MPVFPPTAASTADSRVVGMFMNLIPRLNVDAVKPPMSVIMPPPRHIIAECLVAPPFIRFSHIKVADLRSLFVSPGLIVISVASDIIVLSAFTCGQTSTAVFLSVRTNMPFGLMLFMAVSMACAVLFVNRMFC